MGKNVNIINVSCLAETKFLSMYEVTYAIDEKVFKWVFASRESNLHEINIVDFINRNIECNAIKVLPFFVDKTGKVNVCIINEYRVPFGKMCISLPAGIVEKGENLENAIERELKEEIGATIKGKIKQINPISASSPGLTDETTACFSVEIFDPRNEKTSPEESEVIELKIVSLNELAVLLKNENCLFDSQSSIALKTFYDKYVLAEQLFSKNKQLEEKDVIIEELIKKNKELENQLNQYNK